jgi:hypothetical protein
MRRGTTPVLALLVKDCDLTGSTVFVTLKQQSRMLTKSGGQVFVAYDESVGTLLTVRLEQEDTLRFKDGRAEIQVRWITSTGDAWGTDVEKIDVNKVLLNEVIAYGG